jgi:aspartyl-tRNA(Asn)/glutamyl-tRNA(Gln) amidotransferase subunit B
VSPASSSPSPPSASLEAVIGLEVHAQLSTRSKIFCGCSTAFGARPNTQTCPVCLGLPGALPVLNAAAVDAAIAAAVALDCTVQPVSEFARKNYFYPDLPKGYQISQYDRPLATGGRVHLDVEGARVTVGITRIHMEEDAGKSLHEADVDATRTHIDLNRAGTPLIEIVSEPDIRSAEAAAAYFQHVRDVLVAIGVSDGNLEEGSLRCDANVSVRPHGSTTFGTKVEVKNVNSFRYLQKAVEHEIARQSEAVARGETIVQETRLFDADSGRTVSMRSKEEAHDYRYFPEPDLPLVVVSEAEVARIRARLPELPQARRERFVTQYGLPAYDAGVLTQSRDVADYFEQVASRVAPKAASNWVMGEVLRRIKGDEAGIDAAPVTPDALASLVAAVEGGAISGSVGKEVFEKMWATGEAAATIIEREGLVQIDDESAIRAAIDEVLGANADAVARYREGKTQSFGFLVGQVMKATGGKANPKVVNGLLRRALEA